METDIYLTDIAEEENNYINLLKQAKTDEETRSIIKRIARDEDLLDFEERLDRSNDVDLY
jgi:hypothetical protein